MSLALALLAGAVIVAILLALHVDEGPVSPLSRLRAKRLFLLKLNDVERRLWNREHRLTVTGSSGRQYTLTPYAAFNIRCGEDSYCLRVLGQLPGYDKLLAQRLLVESDEQSFLAIANRRIARVSPASRPTSV